MGSELEAYCETLAATARVDTVCPESEGWTFGPRGRSMAGDADRRYYLIAGWAGGLTPTHCASTCVEIKVIKHVDGVVKFDSHRTSEHKRWSTTTSRARTAC